jgi:putative colanic acid biosynthesis acetyltransferase WcaF
MPNREERIDLSHYRGLPLSNRLRRAVWNAAWSLLFRPSPVVFHAWRRMLLRLFGASIGRGAHVYPSCRIWAPWNLSMGAHSCLSHFVDCYSVDRITLGAHATVSQYSFLCTASHDITHPGMRLLTAPIRIEDQAWVCADVFVAPGVVIGAGAVAAARAVVTRNVEPWTVVGGNPAAFIKKRELRT